MIDEAIIMAGGAAKRMQNDSIPKWFTPIGNDMTIADFQIAWLKKNDIDRIAVTMSNRFRHLRKYIPCSVYWESEPLGDEGGLKAVLGHAHGEEVLVVNGDILTDLDISKLPPAPALVVVHPKAPWGVLRTIYNSVTSGATPVPDVVFEEKPRLPIWISSGIYLFPKTIVLELVDKGNLSQNIIPKLMAQGRLNIYEHGYMWHAVETPKDAEEAGELLSEHGHEA